MQRVLHAYSLYIVYTLHIIPWWDKEGKSIGCLYLTEPLLQTLDKVIKEGQTTIVDDPRCAIHVNIPGRRWHGWLGHTASLIPWQMAPGVVGILHPVVLQAMLPEELTKAAALGFPRAEPLQ